jgi:hypothetical protein
MSNIICYHVNESLIGQPPDPSTTAINCHSNQQALSSEITPLPLTSTGSRVLISTCRVRHHQNCLQNPAGCRRLLLSPKSRAAAPLVALLAPADAVLLLLLRAAMALAQLCNWSAAALRALLIASCRAADTTASHSSSALRRAASTIDSCNTKTSEPFGRGAVAHVVSAETAIYISAASGGGYVAQNSCACAQYEQFSSAGIVLSYLLGYTCGAPSCIKSCQFSSFI